MKTIATIIRTLVAAAILTGLAGSVARAGTTVAAGWDLLRTLPDQTVFLGANWTGDPLGQFNFGSGLVPTANTDTIVRRTLPMTDPGGTIPIELVALNLVSVAPISISGSPLDFHYITLQSDRGGPASGGQMFLQIGPEGDPHGAFSSVLTVSFDVRVGARNGPIFYSDTVVLTTPSVSPWGHLPPGPSPLLIPGVNSELGGPGDHSQDFWPAIGGFAVPIAHEHNTFGLYHTVVVAGEVGVVPEPNAALATGLGLLAGALGFRRVRRPCLV
jgi:hypothetical protein